MTRASQNPMAWFAIFAAATLPLPALAGQEPPRGADLIAALQPAVVNLSVVTYEKAGPVAGNMASQPTVTTRTTESSGFFVAPSGIIVTNRHAVAGAAEITVTLHDTTRLNACVIATAAQSDIALLRVNAGGPVPTVTFGDSDAIRAGDPVIVIGNPLGHGGTVSAGIVSALGRNSVQSEFGSFFQIDASLNQGNSGGPVFNADGALIGVATALFTPGGDTGSVGLGLAIPGNDARLVIERLLQGGQVRLGWIGAHVQRVTADVAAAVKLPSPGGAIVTVVDDDSPASRAGLAAGDVILKVGDADTMEPGVLNRTIAGSTIGGTIAVAVWRDGVRRDVPVMVEESPADKAAKKSTASPACGPVQIARRDLGLHLVPITEEARAALGLAPHAGGVLVSEVAANSVAADRGVAAGAVIVNVQRQPVATPAEALADIDAARESGSDFVLLLVRNAEGLRWMALPSS